MAWPRGALATGSCNDAVLLPSTPFAIRRAIAGDVLGNVPPVLTCITSCGGECEEATRVSLETNAAPPAASDRSLAEAQAGAAWAAWAAPDRSTARLDRAARGYRPWAARRVAEAPAEDREAPSAWVRS
jgi:hypothetical protein